MIEDFTAYAVVERALIAAMVLLGLMWLVSPPGVSSPARALPSAR